MRAKAEIHDLGARHNIEAPHTRQVTKHALDLFDGFAEEMKLDATDRELLYAAASLHDIAYASDPQNHVEEAAKLLRAHPIEAYSDDEWLVVIGIVLLHKRDWRAMLEHEVFPQLGEKGLQRAKTLAAMLRVADGLDHSHIQDAEITYCKRGNKVDKIGVHCAWYANNIAWAEGKADLWEAVHKRPFRIEGNIGHHKQPFKGIVHKKDSALQAARRTLYSQWCIMRDNVPRMLAGTDPESLHDYRVAMRRFRTALKVFKPLLAETCADELNTRMKQLSDQLGPIRDAHVALQLATDVASECPDIIETLKAEVGTAERLLRPILESAECLETVALASRFLRVELPALERNQTSPPYAQFATEQLASRLERVRDLKIGSLRDAEIARLHEVRKKVRRGRYMAEFAAPVDKQARSAAKHLKKVAGALGDVRDGRLLAARFADSALAEKLAGRETEAWEKLMKGWLKLTGD